VNRTDPLAEAVGRALIACGGRLALAESCTGGLIGGRITAVAGSSRWFLGGAVAYHNRIKERLLGVPAATLRRRGAVSAAVAAAMAAGARRAFASDFALAVTGIAGPDGGSAEKPVGLVYVGLAAPGRTRVQKAVFPGSRPQVREQAADLALNLLLSYLEDGR
jgi:nicotinamide-nucleotide amidase